MCKNFYWSFFRNTGALCRKACAWIPGLAGDILDGYYEGQSFLLFVDRVLTGTLYLSTIIVFLTI